MVITPTRLRAAFAASGLVLGLWLTGVQPPGAESDQVSGAATTAAPPIVSTDSGETADTRAAAPTDPNDDGPATQLAAAPAVDLAADLVGRTRAELRSFPAEWPIVRGVYSTMWSFAGERWNDLLDLVATTEINAIVIDVKDDNGMIAWKDSRVAIAHESGADSHTAQSKARAASRIRQLRHAGGYPIARIVCFKDPIAAAAKPELAIKAAGGGVWRDRKGMTWLDANKKDAWDYIVDLGREAARIGFLEIQLDYMRFPTDGNVASAVYDDGKTVDPAAIRGFLAYAREQLHAEGVRVSADIFGLTTYKQEGSGDGDGTGQLFEDVISEVDYVSPMVYPSHYYPGNYGLARPEAHPYDVVVNAMREAQERVDGYRAKVRPWLEDFSLTVPHHPGRVSDQLRATYDNGIESWLLWNAHNRYSREALAPVLRPRAVQAPPEPPAEQTPPEQTPPEQTPSEQAPAETPTPLAMLRGGHVR
ncbi:MAG: hypothetical protein M3N57_08385 [Actinomycetota bacterium]|nr:hypothetical protein [Actinomycetota bacterium]